MAGGTFATLAPVLHADQARTLVTELRAGLEHKIVWQGNPLDLSVSIGYAHWPEHESDTERLLRRAELAMYEAKRLGRDAVAYNPSTEAAREQDLRLLSDLAEAVKRDELRQFLQPKLDLATGQIIGAEALIRWQHPSRGWLPPGEFVPFAERSGRVGLITDWMINRAIETLARWQAEGREPIYIAVNISILDIRDTSLPVRVAQLLEKHGVNPALLQLEVTESRLMDSGLNPIAVLNALRDWGVRLAIDDFGTGHSSLAYLQHLPVDELKIDRSFVQEVHAEPRREALLRSIAGLGGGLGLTVTAEGVETEAELAVIRACGCHLVQGYLLAKPMDAPDFEAWLAARAGQG
jgi:predicted signal transduction protein with EAL and GGDEF domain